MSTTYEFGVDGGLRGVGDDADEEEVVVADVLLLDGGCREGRLRNREKDGVRQQRSSPYSHRPRLAISRTPALGFFTTN
jgi:hypothetical protein